LRAPSHTYEGVKIIWGGTARREAGKRRPVGRTNLANFNKARETKTKGWRIMHRLLNTTEVAKIRERENGLRCNARVTRT